MLADRHVVVKNHNSVFCYDFLFWVSNLTINSKLDSFGQVTNGDVLANMKSVENTGEHALIICHFRVYRFDYYR